MNDEYKRTKETITINDKNKYIYYKQKSRVKYIKHKNQYLSVKDYKKMMRETSTKKSIIPQIRHKKT